MKLFLNTTDINNPTIEITENKTEIKKNELGLFELHVKDEFGEGITLIKKTKKEITDFLKETNQ
jgi:hypothetical protein